MLFRLVVKYWYQFSLSAFVAITIFSLIPLAQLPEFPGSDKTHHFMAYGALMFPVALRLPKHWFWLACFFASWSAGIELVQPLVNRYGEWLDLLANVAGLFIGLILGLAVKKLYLTDKNRQTIP